MRLHAPALALALLVAPAAVAKTPDELDLKKKVSLNFENTRLQIVLAAIQDATEINIAVDPAVDIWTSSVTANASEERVGTLLDQIQQQLELSRTEWCNTLYLHPKGKQPPAEPALAEGPVAKALDTRLRSITFERAQLGEVIQRLKAKSEIEFGTLSFPIRKYLRASGVSVTFRLWNPRVRDVIGVAARACGLTWSVTDKGKVAFSGAGAGAAASADDDVTLPNVVAGGKLIPDSKVDVDRLIRQMARPSTRATASMILIREGKAVTPKVASLLKGENDEATVLAALNVLTEIGDPGEYAAVLDVFKTGDVLDVRRAAGDALGAMKPTEAIDDLIAALDDPWFRISETARSALVSIGSPAIPPLVKAFEAESANKKGKDGIVYRALLIFGEVGDTLAKKTLLSAIKRKGGKRNLAIRHHAAIGLGMCGDVRVVEPLILAFEKEEDFRVAKYISRSLTWLTDHKVGARRGAWRIWWEQEGRRKLQSRKIDPLKGVGGEVRLKRKKDGLPELESTDAAIKRLCTELGAEDPGVRKSAWRDLQTIGEKALPALRETAKTGNENAKKNAAAIIKRLTEE